METSFVDVYLYDENHEQLPYHQRDGLKIALSQGAGNPITPEPESPEPQKLHLRFRVSRGVGDVFLSITGKLADQPVDFRRLRLTGQAESVLRLCLAPISKQSKASFSSMPGRLVELIDEFHADRVSASEIREKLSGYTRLCLVELAGSADVATQDSLAKLLDRLYPTVPMTFSHDDRLLVASADRPASYSFGNFSLKLDWLPVVWDLFPACMAFLDDCLSCCWAAEYDLRFPDERSITPQIGRIRALAYDRDRCQLAVGGSNGVVAVYDLKPTISSLPSNIFYAGPAAIQAIAFSPDGTRLGIATLSGQVLLHNVHSKTIQDYKLLLPVEVGPSSGYVPTAVTFSHEGTQVAVAVGIGGSGMVYLMGVDGSGEPRLAYIGREAETIQAMRFSSRTSTSSQQAELLIASINNGGGGSEIVVTLVPQCESNSLPDRELARFPLHM